MMMMIVRGMTSPPNPFSQGEGSKSRRRGGIRQAWWRRYRWVDSVMAGRM